VAFGMEQWNNKTDAVSTASTAAFFLCKARPLVRVSLKRAEFTGVPVAPFRTPLFFRVFERQDEFREYLILLESVGRWPILHAC
jgi:hypothetical protein